MISKLRAFKRRGADDPSKSKLVLWFCTMEHLTPSQLQKLLEDEATALRIMQSKISNQIHLLQVEEELFRQELENLQRERLAKDYSNQDGVNQIVEVTNDDVAEEDDDSVQTTERDRADGAENSVVEIAGEDLAPGVSETQEVPQEKGAEGVNRIEEITGDEDEVMRESTGDRHGPSASSRPWSEQHHGSNLEYEILEPSSDESETDVEDSNSGKRRMLSITFPSRLSTTIVGEKRRREEPAEQESDLNSEMEVEEDSDDQISPAVSPARSPPRKKETPRRKPVGS